MTDGFFASLASVSDVWIVMCGGRQVDGCLKTFAEMEGAPLLRDRPTNRQQAEKERRSQSERRFFILDGHYLDVQLSLIAASWWSFWPDVLRIVARP